jgi:hypothetical protein
MVEWGLTYEQFQQQPLYILGKIKEFRSAKINGQQRYNDKQK